MYKTAILVDGGFFLKRYPHIYPKNDRRDAALMAAALYELATRHLSGKTKSKGKYEREGDLYRLFFYDSPPLEKRIHTPVGHRAINLAKSKEAVFRRQLHSQLLKKRKVALRLGRLETKTGTWKIRPAVQKELIKSNGKVYSLTDENFALDVGQKGVDMRIGLDIASMSLKQQVDRIVLMAGDSDFVPAAKLARREGVDFILDPLWLKVSDDLSEHVDGLRSTSDKPKP